MNRSRTSIATRAPELDVVRERGADELAQSLRSHQIQTPSHPAARAIWGRYSVCEFLCSDHDWSWVLLEPSEEGLPVTKVPRLPSGSLRSGSSSFDAIVERRLTHSPDPVLARDASNLALISGPSRLRPDLDVAEVSRSRRP